MKRGENTYDKVLYKSKV